jgi:hypothetical protein
VQLPGIYNVFNQVSFATVDSTARFDAAGNQVNTRFGHTRFGQVITTHTTGDADRAQIYVLIEP